MAASTVLVPVAWGDSPEPKAAPAAAKLVFEDERALKVGWPRLEAGLELEVCNTGDKEGTFQPRLVGFDFEIDDQPAQMADVAAIGPATVTVGAGKCAPLSIDAGLQSPDAGDYTGVVVLRTPTALVRREVTITAPKANQTNAVPLVEEVGIRALRNGMPAELKIDRPASLPLRGRGERLLVPAKDETIGVLQSGPHRLFVIVDGAPTPSNSPRYLPIRLAGSDETGTYTGTVDLGVGEAVATPIKVKVEASDSWWVAPALITLGLGLALLTLLHLQRWRPERQLHDRRRELSELYRKAKDSFDAHYGQSRFGEYGPDLAAIAVDQATLDSSIRRYANDNVLFKRDSDEFKQIVRTLHEAEADAAFFADQEGFGKTLTALETTVTEFQADYPDSVPRFIEHAAARLKGCALPLGAATTINGEAKAYIAFAAVWKKIAREVKRLEAWVAQLEQANLDDSERKLLATAKAKVNEAKMELRDAEDAASLESVGAQRDLRRAYGLLAVLGSKYGWAPEAEQVHARALEDIRSESFVIGMPQGLDDLIARAQGLPLVGFVTEAVGRTVRRAADAAVLLIAILAAILVAWPTVVADETFGSWRDYLLALGLGGTSAAAAKGIVDVVSQLRRPERVE